MTDITTSADESTITQVTAEHYIVKPSKHGPIPSLVVSIDLGDVIGTDWTYDSVLSFGDGTGTDITLLFYPQGDHEGWQRLDEVGEW
jgi:hypothetical protein